MPAGLGFYIPEEGAGEGVQALLYISLERKIRGADGEWEDDASEWTENLRVNRPSLDFRIRYGDGPDEVSDNLFGSNIPDTQMDTGKWTAPKPIEKVLEGMKVPAEGGDIYTDDENYNPFMIYARPSLPEEGAIPIDNLAVELNKRFGGKDLFFEYKVALARVPGEDWGEGEPGEILLYPAMFEKKIVVSVDMLIIIPLAFQADKDKEEGAVMTIDPDLGDKDLFGRSSVDDDGFFDMVTSFEFNIAIKNAAGLSAGKLFLENKTDSEEPKYELLVIDFAEPRNNLSLDSGKMEDIRKQWPFIPQASIRFEPGATVRIERGFNIGLQSVSVRVGGEYTFETGL
jgi:hypothetical protein